MKNNLLTSFIWKFAERCGTQCIQFIVQIILARMILPEEYGLIGLITIFIAISNVFVQSGFSTALIQKEHVNSVDYSSVFWITTCISIIMYITLYITSPVIAYFYNNYELIAIIRVLALTIFFGAFNSIQIAKLTRDFDFHKMFKSSIGSAMISGGIGIGLAYIGFGVWALVFQQLLNQIIITLIMIITVRWFPTLEFSFRSAKQLFSFGKNLLFSSLLDTIYNNLYGLIIGKIYSAKILGYYNRADQFPKMIVLNINGSVQSVLLSAMSRNQKNKILVKDMTRKSIQLVSFFLCPLLIGMAACADDIIRLLLTEQWYQCVPYMQILCFAYLLWPIHTANLQAINAIGRSDIFLKLEIIKKTIGILSIFITASMGIWAMLIAQPVLNIVFSFFNAYPNTVLLNYQYKEQLSDFIGSFRNAIIMGMVINLFSSMISINILLKLIIEVMLGIAIYFFLSKITKNQSFYIVKNLFFLNTKERFSKNK